MTKKNNKHSDISTEWPSTPVSDYLESQAGGNIESLFYQIVSISILVIGKGIYDIISNSKPSGEFLIAFPISMFFLSLSLFTKFDDNYRQNYTLKMIISFSILTFFSIISFLLYDIYN